MTDEVTRFPVMSWKRTKNKRGKLSVSCIVTDRWLRFDLLPKFPRPDEESSGLN